MERDLDCIRYILLKIEENASPASEFINYDLICEEYGGETIDYHLKLLIDKKYIEVLKTKYLDEDYDTYVIQRITMEGHDFLDNIRSDEIYEKTKQAVKAKGVTVGLEIIGSIALKLIKEKFNLPL